jgi:CheY-like chemotaxis protein
MPASDTHTILLVEDNLDDVILTRRALRQSALSARLMTVGDGDQALDYLLGAGAFGDRGQHPFPELVLLDWKLPRCSGSEVLRRIRARSEMDRLPVVILTSSRQQEDIDEAYACGAKSYLQKPVAFSALVELLGRLHLYWLRTNVTAAR